MKKALCKTVLTAICLCVPIAASATTLDLTPTGESWLNTTGNIGTGRSVYLEANDTFPIDSISFYGDLVTASYDAVIWAGAGETSAPGAELKVGTAALTNAGLGFYTVPISYTFTAGQEYIVGIQRTDGTGSFATSYDYMSWGNGTEQSNIGLVTLLDGREGLDAVRDNNSWLTHFQMNVVPEPSTVLLLGAGLVGLAARGRRREA
jgi:hypothetical protein